MTESTRTTGSKLSFAATSLPGRITLAIIVVVWTMPAAGVLVTSLRRGDAAGSTGWWRAFTDPQLTFDNYRQVLDSSPTGGGMLESFWASLAITVPATVAPLVLAVAAAYVFAWTRFSRGEWLFLAVVGLALVPVHMTLVPLVSVYTRGVEVAGVQLVPDLGLAGEWLGLWLAHTAFALPVAILLLRAAMAQVPANLVDAARSDGAGHLDTLMRVVVPLTVPALVAVGALQFLWVWNDFLVVSALLGEPDVGLSPLTVGLAELVSTRGQNLELLSAATVVTAAVPLVVYACLQRLVVSGARAATFDH